MKKLDFKSLIIGMLGTVLVFVTIGSQKANKNMGDIVVNSITVVGENNQKVCFINEYIEMYNNKENITAYFGTSNETQSGLITLNNKFGAQGWRATGFY